ncbi:MAG: transcription termination factor NusA [Patescibacteria group bacterium]|jgi:N utilization substance protein A
MAQSPFALAINQICDEKGLSRDTVVETIESAVAAAYRKDYGKPNQIIKTKINQETGEFDVWRVYNVVEDEEQKNPEAELTLAEAKEIDKKAILGETVSVQLEPHSDFGRIAAQTAKQVVIQRLREAERSMLYGEFKEKEGQLINGTIQQIENNNVIINLGKLNGIMPPPEQVRDERYYVGQRLRVYIKLVEDSVKGLTVVISRADAGLIRGLFALEVPEINSGSVEIKTISREAGSRSKVAVFATEEGIDAVGSCVGQRATRIQAILAEIGEEKIDIIPWDADDEKFIASALSPAKIEKIELDPKESKAIVYVPEDQLSLAIGKAGQNVRLASKLSGWSIDIENIADAKPVEKAKTKVEKNKEEKETKPKKAKKAKKIDEASAEIIETPEVEPAK